MAEMRQTHPGVWERMGEARWQSPYHQVSMEYEAGDGTVKRRNVEGIRKSTRIISFRENERDKEERLRQEVLRKLESHGQ